VQLLFLEYKRSNCVYRLQDIALFPCFNLSWTTFPIDSIEYSLGRVYAVNIKCTCTQTTPSHQMFARFNFACIIHFTSPFCASTRSMHIAYTVVCYCQRNIFYLKGSKISFFSIIWKSQGEEKVEFFFSF